MVDGVYIEILVISPYTTFYMQVDVPSPHFYLTSFNVFIMFHTESIVPDNPCHILL